MKYDSTKGKYLIPTLNLKTFRVKYPTADIS